MAAEIANRGGKWILSLGIEKVMLLWLPSIQLSKGGAQREITGD
jgi:hypothetical protein